MHEIKSLQNERIKNVIKLHSANGRKKAGAFFIEGVKQVEEALRDCPKEIMEIFATHAHYEALPEGTPKTLVSSSVMAKMSLQKTPEGILAVIHQQHQMNMKEKMLLLDGVADPGNCGTLIRTAEAFDFGVALTEGSVDPYNPKVVQSAKGSLLRLKPQIVTLDDVQKWATEYTFYGAVLEDSLSLHESPKKSPFVLVLGSESHGISNRIRPLLDYFVRIDMTGVTESLNVAVAGGILMHYFIKA